MKSYVFENKNFSLTVGENAIAESLVYKTSGEQLLMKDKSIALFSLTQLRPFNNEVKLAHMNKRTTYEANSISVEDNKITVGFETIPCRAVVSVHVTDEYIEFTLEDFVFSSKAYSSLCMDLPPVEEFRLLQLPIRTRKNFGQWVNAIWDDDASCAVVAATPEALVDSEKRNGYRILTADAKAEVQLKGTSAALIVSGGKEKFLGAMNSLEKDFNLPLGVESRKNPMINRSIYWIESATLEEFDEHIRLAKMGGFTCMLLNFTAVCPHQNPPTYGACGDYSVNPIFKNGYEGVRELVGKIKAAGITPGLHFLHTHIGYLTKYVTPVVDPRLNITDYYTLCRPLGTDDDKIYVAENPKNAKMHEKRRVLKFGGELMSYEGFSTEAPYHFYGVKRGYWNTTVTPHEAGIIGGVLDISEYCAESVYINQNTDLQDEIADEIAKLYDCGFEFIYFDGSEGTGAPYEYQIPIAQYKVFKKLGSSPIFCEGAAKAHFNWHFLSGANAFDIFETDVFKDMIDAHPLAEAPLMAADFTRLNFGWWAFYDDTRRDVYEYGTSHACGWDCPVTIQASLKTFDKHARFADIFEVMRRWESVRINNLLTEEQKELIRIPGREYTLFVNESGEFELIEYFECSDFCPENKELHAFTLERNGRCYALLWHDTASLKIEIPLSHIDTEYYSDLTREALDIKICENSIIIDVSASAYLSMPVSMEDMRLALSGAKILR